LASVAQALPRAIKVQHVFVMRDDIFSEGVMRWHVTRDIAASRFNDLSCRPGRAIVPTANHDSIRTRQGQRTLGGYGIYNITIDDKRNVDGILDRTNCGPVRLALVELLAGTAMDGDHTNAGSHGTAGNVGSVEA